MIIGLTGGIGTGKSTVLSLLKDKYGFTIFEADKVAHEIMNKGYEAYDKILEYFGNEILNPDLTINRRVLSDIVFRDREKLNVLNEIVHPAVISKILSEIERCRREKGTDRFVIEAALLFESGCDKICDSVWYIYADKEVRTDRLIKGRGMTGEQIESVMKNQLDKELFIQNSDIIIDNSGTIESTDEQIEKLLVF